MSKIIRRSLILASIIAINVISSARAAPPAPIASGAIGENQKENAAARLWAEFARAPDSPVRFIVYFRDKADVSPAYAMSSRAARAAFVYNALRETAARSQAGALAFLNTHNARVVQSLWICNALVVKGDAATARALAARPEVAYITLDEKRQYLAPPPDVGAGIKPASTEWNITHVGAARVWNELGVDGQGVVVANMDTGVLYTHPALNGQYRGKEGGDGEVVQLPVTKFIPERGESDGQLYDHNYNWYDATGTYPTAPGDGHGHGTHTMGTIVGAAPARAIGVAPGAQWIAVKALDDWGNGYDSQLHAAFQWILAPTALNGANPDPTRAPHILNNSWGARDGTLTNYHEDIEMLIAAGIIPIFSAGNSGPDAGTIGSPASFGEALAVGAVDSEDYVADFSSRGPSPLTEAIKPEICAPGVEIYSSARDGDYVAEEGTSMAAPHIAGVAALMLQANPLLDYDQIRMVITATALDLGAPGPDYDCGWGRVDAYAAVSRVQLAGQMYGQVRDDAGAGINVATLVATGQDKTYLTRHSVDAQGYYTLPLPVGSYTVIVTAYGYYSAATTADIVTKDDRVPHDFTLTAKPRYRLSGRVTDLNTGLPLAATVTVLHTPIIPLVTALPTGAYETEIAEGNYILQADKFGYEAETRGITASQDVTADFSLAQLAPILLVDDDGGADDQSALETALTALRQSYQVWDVSRSGAPPASYLQQFPILIWNTGLDRENSLSFTEQNAIMAYLDAGGNLLLSSKGYPTDSRGDREFTPVREVAPTLKRDYLHFSGDNHWRRISDIVGVDENPIGAWMGTIPVIVSSYSVSSITPDEFALAAFTSKGHTIATTYHDREKWYRAAFFSVGLETLEPGGLQTLLHRVIRWFRQGSVHGDITGQINNVYTVEGVGQVAITARGIWDGYTAISDARGYYTLSLLLGDYDLAFDRAGYFSDGISNVSVTTETVATRSISLTPHVALSPTALAHSLVAGEFWTTTLTISNAGGSAFHYGSYERDVAVQIAADAAPLDVPYSEVAPTIDGYYTDGEWEDANVVFLTNSDEPSGAEMGQALIKHAAGNLYVLLDYEGQTSSSVNISGKIWFDRDGDGESDGGFHARKYYNSLYKYFDYPGSVAVNRTTTPGSDRNHWIYEFEIPLETTGLRLDSAYRVHFILYDEARQQGGEWLNTTKEAEEDYPERWGAMRLLPRRAIWLDKSPIGVQIGAESAQVVALTFDGRVVQPGQHIAELVLPSRHQSYPIINPVVPLSFTVTPAPNMGKLSGKITDRRTGQPITATVAEVGGLAVETDPIGGTYAIWLREGTRELELSAAGYISRRVMVEITAQVSTTRDFILQYDSPELVLPPALDFALDYGESLTAALVISNKGSRQLEFQIYETTVTDDLQIGKLANGQMSKSANGQMSKWANGQMSKRRRGEIEKEKIGGNRARSLSPISISLADLQICKFADLSLNPFLFDLAGEEADMAVDLLRGEALVKYDTMLQHFRLTFSDASDLWHTVGYVLLDTDRNPATGRSPAELSGDAAQDIGFDYYFDLFSMPWAQEIDVWRADGQYVGTVLGTRQSDALEWSVPLTWLQSVDGVMDVTMVLGNQAAAIDWGPAQGHSTVGVGANWLTEAPDNGAVAVEETYTVTLSFNGAGVQPGVHALRLALRTNDPLSPTAYIPITVTVQPASDMRKVTGQVINRATGQGLYALVAVDGGAHTFSDRLTGAYELWLTPGVWRVRAATLELSDTKLITVSGDGAQGALELHFALGDYAVYLPIILK